jgi:hypothetical protein
MLTRSDWSCDGIGLPEHYQVLCDLIVNIFVVVVVALDIVVVAKAVFGVGAKMLKHQ